MKQILSMIDRILIEYNSKLIILEFFNKRTSYEE